MKISEWVIERELICLRSMAYIDKNIVVVYIVRKIDIIKEVKSEIPYSF